MAVPIASLFIDVSADVSAAISGLNALNNKLTGTTNSFQQAAPAALLLSGAAAGVGAAFFGAVKTAATFEKAMSGVKAVMTPGDVQKFGGALEDLAVSLGEKTSFNAMQTAAAIEELIKQGIPAESVLGGAADAVLALAAATGTAPAEAATVAAQAMNAFKVSVADLPSVVDRLAGVTNVTAADMGGLRLALQQVGAVAHLAGFSFEDTVTAIGAMANAGVVGSDAGTSLKTMFLNLVPSTKQQTAAFKNLGIITADGANQFFDATGKVKNMAGVAGVLENALSGMTHEQKLATAQTLFGTDAMRAAAILSDLGAKGFADLSGEVKKVSAADQAAERLNNLLGSLEQLGGAFQSVQIRIGKLFLPEIRAVVDAVKGVVTAFGQMTPEQQKSVAVFGLIAGAVAGAIGGFVLLAPSIQAMGPAFLSLGKILGSVALPFKVLAVIGAALFAAWQTNFGGIRSLVEKSFGSLPDLLGHIGDIAKKAFSGDFGGAFDTFRAVVRALSPELGDFVDNVLPGLITAALNVKAFWDNELSPALGRVGAFLKDEVGPRIAEFVSTVFPKLQDGAAKIKTFWDNELSPALNRFGAFLKDEVGPRIREFAESVLPKLQEGAKSVKEFWENELSPALQRVGVFLETEVTPKVKQFAENVLPALQAGADKVASFWDNELAPALRRLGAFLDTEVAPKIQTFVDTVMPKLNEGAQAIITFWNDHLLPTLRDPGPTLDSLATSFEGAVGRIGTAAETGKLGAGAEALSLFFANFDTIKGQVESLAPLFDSIGKFAGSILALDTAIAALASRSAAPIFDAIGQSIKGFSDAVAPSEPTIAALGQGLGKIGDFLQPATIFFTNLADAITKFTDAVNKAPNLQAFLPSGTLAPGQAGPLATPTANVTDAIGAAAGGALAGAAGGPLVQIGQLLISNEAEANAFLQRMAAAVRGAVGRVNAPPDNSAFPALGVTP